MVEVLTALAQLVASVLARTRLVHALVSASDSGGINMSVDTDGAAENDDNPETLEMQDS